MSRLTTADKERLHNLSASQWETERRQRVYGFAQALLQMRASAGSLPRVQGAFPLADALPIDETYAQLVATINEENPFLRGPRLAGEQEWTLVLTATQDDLDRALNSIGAEAEIHPGRLVGE